MTRLLPTVFVACVAVTTLALRARAAEPTEVERLILALAEPDPAARQAAAEKLLEMGADARPALVAASQSEDPEIRSRAGQLLRELPWSVPSDPAAVRQLLQNYGKIDEAERISVAIRLENLDEGAGVPALLRLLREETSDDVRWELATLLRQRSDTETLERLRRLEAEDDDAISLTLAGWAWLGRDRGKAAGLFRRAIDLDGARSSSSNALLGATYDYLIESAVDSGQYDAAANLLRRQAATARQVGELIPPAVLRLFIIHANHGPLAGLDDDVARHRALLARPELMYAIGQMYRQHGITLPARVATEMAFAATPNTKPARLRIGEFLLMGEWYDLAERELRAALDAPADRNGAAFDANIHFRLASVAVGRDDDFAAAEHMEQGLDWVDGAPGDRGPRGRGGLQLAPNVAIDRVRATIHWRYLRAAQKRSDVEAMKKHVDEIVALAPSDLDIALDVVPALKELNRPSEAETMFAAAYDALKQRLERDPTSAEHKNNLAWLCARCGERLDEALRLSQEAIATAPENYAYLDTAAEAQFRNGNAAEAVRLETRALELKPNDEFIQEQLERFQKSAQSE